MKKRALSLLLALVMVIGLFPMTANADELGNGIEYEVDGDHVVITNYYGEATYLTIPNTIESLPVTVIDDYAFFYSNELVGITIPNSVTEIGAHAFAYCEKLESISIPDKVTAIEAGTFSECSNLKTVDLPSGLVDIGNGAFYLCSKLSSITIPTNVTSIGMDAFWDCDSLTSINIPANVTSIGMEAFWDCDSLTSINIPASVNELSSYSFAHCDKLTAIQVDAANPEYCSRDGALYTKDMTRLICCPGGKQGSFTLPASVTYLDSASTNGCDRLTKILVESGSKSFCSADGILYSADMIRLIRCPGGKSGSITIPEPVEVLGDYSFLECTKLTDVKMPSTLRIIGSLAFNSCTNLHTIIIPASPDLIGYCAFYDSGLTSICFKGDAPEFDDYAFDTITATAYYPVGNPTWTADVMQDYEGTITWVAHNPAMSFLDVPAGSFYENPVLWAVENGITTGASATSFNPDGSCLRAQVVTFLHRAAENPEPTSTKNPFTDVNTTDFFYKPVLWAVEKGITNGISAAAFGSYATCNRAAVVTFLWRAADKPEPTSQENPFTDVTENDYFYKAVLWALENGITTGTDATHFSPNSACNRAQVVTFLYRAYN